MRKIAELAGVSPATVSRVLSDHPHVARETAASVHRAIQELQVVPRSLPRRNVRPGTGCHGASVAFLVLGTTGSAPAPAFEKLLSGVSAAAADQQLNLIFSFVSDPAQLPPRITDRRVDGVLLHGEKPSPALEARLRALPTVWLMANRQRPEWGDQVLPDNDAIGDMAAGYLLARGHRRLAYLGIGSGLWGMEVRSLAFARAAGDAGARAEIFNAEMNQAGDLWCGEGLLRAGRLLVDRMLAAAERPTGVFVSEDRLLPAVDAALRSRGLVSGAGRDVELISCNNERPHVASVQEPPAEIDIRAESIGRRGVEQLVWRLRNPQDPERVRAMVEPALVEPVAVRPARVEPARVATRLLKPRRAAGGRALPATTSQA